ncbi:hypothetical protein V6N12_069254 [Hibiscus sabdariffa]|uniref:HAT C-terminal dimerisation domain-containing protein n=1 Tax=Hibiscus sabdariffa TaxID=183260 RepID=A0ABR2FDG9_9ROSI
MKPKDASKLGHDIETPHDLLKDSSDVVNSGLSHGAPSSIPSNLHLPPKKTKRHKMDYVIFVIEEVYDEKKSDELSVLVKQTLNELFDHYSLLSGISKDESNVSSQSNLSRVESDELDLFAYSKSKYKRKRAESVFSEGKTKVEKYLEDKVEPDVDRFDVLAWWKNKSFEDLRLNETTMTIDD